MLINFNEYRNFDLTHHWKSAPITSNFLSFFFNIIKFPLTSFFLRLITKHIVWKFYIQSNESFIFFTTNNTGNATIATRLSIVIDSTSDHLSDCPVFYNMVYNWWLSPGHLQGWIRLSDSINIGRQFSGHWFSPH